MGTGLRQRLRQGPAVIGSFVVINAPESVELLAQAGYELVVIDCEHGPFAEHAVGPMVLTARAAGVYCLVRVRTADPSLIGPALDAGADGVLVPQIDSAASAAAVTRAARYGPAGNRGVHPYVRAASFAATPEWYAAANERAAVLVMVEGQAGLAALPEILTVPELDGVMVGPYDLSQAIGRPGQVDHPEVLATASRIIGDTAEAGLATAIYAPTAADARRWRDAGARLILLGVDTSMALAGFRLMLADL